jgi:drug/metabolite transporter (DMT)-like permease
VRPGPWSVATVVLFGLMVLAWGGNYLFVRAGEAYVSPLWLATLRASVGAAGVGAFLLLRPSPASFSSRDRRDALLLGIPNTGVFLALWFIAASAVAPGTASVIVYTFPLWVALFSPAVLGTKLGGAHWAAVAIGFGGVILVSQPWITRGGSAGLQSYAELLGAAVAWAAGTVLIQRRFPPGTLAIANGYQLLGGALFLAAASLSTGQVTLAPGSGQLWVAVLWLGLYGTAFAYGVWFFLLERMHASTLSALSFLVPLTALALSAVFFAERLAPVQLLGVALVLVGIYLVGRSRLELPVPVRNDPSG